MIFLNNNTIFNCIKYYILLVNQRCYNILNLTNFLIRIIDVKETSTSTSRVNLFNIKYKSRGGDILHGIKINPDVNKELKELVNETGLSKTKIINNSIMIYKKFYLLDPSNELLDTLFNLYRKKNSSSKSLIKLLKNLESELSTDIK